MLFDLGLVSTLLASAALAHPLQDRENHLSTRNLTSSIWTGVEYLGEGPGSFTVISGTFVAPTINTKSVRFESPVKIFTGLDGISCSNVWLRAGIEILPDSNGNPYYNAYFDAHPNYGRHYLEDISVSAGDTIKLTVFVPATTSGSQNVGFAVVENLSKHQSAAEEVPFNGGETLCGQDTVLVVEAGASSSVADFGTVYFTNIESYTARDPSVSHGSTLVQLERNGATVARASLDAQDAVLVQYLSR